MRGGCLGCVLMYAVLMVSSLRFSEQSQFAFSFFGPSSKFAPLPAAMQRTCRLQGHRTQGVESIFMQIRVQAEQKREGETFQRWWDPNWRAMRVAELKVKKKQQDHMCLRDDSQQDYFHGFEILTGAGESIRILHLAIEFFFDDVLCPCFFCCVLNMKMACDYATWLVSAREEILKLPDFAFSKVLEVHIAVLTHGRTQNANSMRSTSRWLSSWVYLQKN
jgi:hypothetical protein